MPTESVTERDRFFRNSIYGLLSWLLPIIPTMIATPIVVERLGKDQYGVLVVLISFISYFFTTAIGKVAAKYVAEYRSTGETEKISGMISATIILGVGITLLGSTLTLLFSKVIVVDILSIPPDLQDRALTGLYLACATILSIVVGQVFQLALQGLHRFDRYLMLANFTSISFSLGSIGIVLLGYGLVELLAWNLITWLIVTLLSYLAMVRILPEFRFTVSIPREVWRAVWAYSLSIMGYQLFGTMLLFFERGWIMRTFGATEMTFYAIPMTLALYLHLFTASLVLAMFPIVNELLTKPEKLRDLYQRSTKIVVMLMAFALVSIVVCGRSFLGVWLGEEYAAACYSLLIIHSVTFAMLALNTIGWQIAEGFRAASLNTYGTIFWMVVGIATMILFSGVWQVEGVAAGRMVGAIIFVPLIFYIEKRFLGGITWSFWGSSLIRILAACVPAVIAELILISLFPSSWHGFLGAVLIGGTVYIAALFGLGFVDPSEKKMIADAYAKYR